MARTQFLQALSVQEAAYQEFTHMTTLSAGVEVNETGVAVAQTFKLGKLRLGSVIRRAALTLVTPFENTADAAFNTTTIVVKTLSSVGADVTTVFAAQELNKNGTEIAVTQVNNTPSVGALAGETLVAVITGMAAKSLSNLNKGQVQVYFEIHAPIALQEVAAYTLPLVRGAGLVTIEQVAELRGVTVEEAQAQIDKEEEEERERMQGKVPGTEDEAVDYETKTVPELKELAAQRGVDVPYDARKDEIIKVLKKSDKEAVKA